MIDTISLDETLGHPRILVLGDAMLDRYTWGNAERVSPEAPVLVLRADQREVRLGGAASVALLLRGLEADVTLAAVVGDDHDGRTIRRLIDEAEIDARLIVIDPGRPTTTKERFLGRSEHRQPHQMLRVDSESCEILDDSLIRDLLNTLAQRIAEFDAVIISDYAKGFCTEQLVSQVISLCDETQVPVLVDPGRGTDFGVYRGATLLKPNRLEAELAVGCRIRTPESALVAAAELRQRFDVESVLITLDRDGLVIATQDGSEHQQIAPRHICDITGAGDTVIATLGIGLAAGLSVSTSAKLANIAAGLQVTQSGVAPIPRKTLLSTFQQRVSDATSIEPHLNSGNEFSSQLSTGEVGGPAVSSSKVVTRQTAQTLAAAYRQAGRTLVFTNGCFDLLHVGHIAMLEESASLGEVLFVAINSDASVRQLKGDERPIINERDRARMLAALNCVDHVLVFDEPTPHRLLEAIRPDVLVKGGTTPDIIGREIVEAYGGRVRRTAEVPGWSTTTILTGIRSARELTSQKDLH